MDRRLNEQEQQQSATHNQAYHCSIRTGGFKAPRQRPKVTIARPAAFSPPHRPCCNLRAKSDVMVMSPLETQPHSCLLRANPRSSRDSGSPPRPSRRSKGIIRVSGDRRAARRHIWGIFKRRFWGESLRRRQRLQKCHPPFGRYSTPAADCRNRFDSIPPGARPRSRLVALNRVACIPILAAEGMVLNDQCRKANDSGFGSCYADYSSVRTGLAPV